MSSIPEDTLTISPPNNDYSSEKQNMYTICDQGYYNVSPQKTSAAKRCDKEVSYILRNIADKSPRSLLDLDKTNNQESDRYDESETLLDGSKRRDNSGILRKSRSRLDEKDMSSKGMIRQYINSDSGTISVSPPHIQRKISGQFTVNFGSNSPGVKQTAIKARGADSPPPATFPEHPFPLNRKKWNPHRSGMFPSSCDTYGSTEFGSLDYGSLEYSSEDQSLDSSIDRKRKKSVSFTTQTSKAAKHLKPYLHKIGSEHLPLVPELPTTRPEENDYAMASPDIQSSVESITPKREKISTKRRTSFRRSHKVTHLVSDVRGTKQATSCRDYFFAMLFYAQLAIILFLGIQLGPQALGYQGTGMDITIETGGVQFMYRNAIILACGSGLISIAISTCLLIFMTTSARSVVLFALFVSISLSLTWGVIGVLLSTQTFVFLPVMGLTAFGLSLAYTFTVWDRIPFVTAQLKIALLVIRENYALVILGLVVQILSLLWILFYFVTCIGIYDYFQVDNLDLSQKCRTASYIGLCVSLLWTFQVFSHVLKVTTCGVVNHWWFKSEYDRNNLDVLGESFLRAGVFSFGSVCFGSLFIGFANFFRHIAGYIRPNREEAAMRIFVVFQEVIVSTIDFVCIKFSNWAFAYVGMYGYDYLEAGKHANELFARRGWKEIISDDLIEIVLFSLSLVIGGVVGCIAVLSEDAGKTQPFSLNHPSLVAFLIGFVVGALLTSMLFSIISSSVNGVIICFAGSPDKLEENHPIESQELRSAWKSAWPRTVDNVSSNMSPSNLTIDSPGPHYLLGKQRQKLDELFI